MSVTGPIIPELVESSRLILLSPPRSSHDQAYVNMLNDPISMEFLSAMSKADSGGYILQDAVDRRAYTNEAQKNRSGWFCHILLKKPESTTVTATSVTITVSLPCVNMLSLKYLNELPTLSVTTTTADSDKTSDAGSLEATKVAGIEYLSTAEFVGVTGFRSIDWHNLQAEVGIILCSEHFKQGICTESLYMVLLIGFEVLHLNRITFVTTVTNKGMNHFLQSIGVSLEGVLREFFLNTWETTANGSTDANSYAILASEWSICKAKLEERFA